MQTKNYEVYKHYLKKIFLLIIPLLTLSHVKAQQNNAWFRAEDSVQHVSDSLKIVKAKADYEKALEIIKRDKVDSSLIDPNRSGKGNNTLAITLISLENIVNTYTISSFEKSMGVWDLDNLAIDGSQIQESYNKKCDCDLPSEYEICYATSVNKINCSIKIEASFNKRITGITYTAYMPGLWVGRFKRSLAQNGFVLNETTSGIVGHAMYDNGKYSVSINDDAPGGAIIHLWKDAVRK